MLCESELGAYFLNKCNIENMRFLLTHSVFGDNYSNLNISVRTQTTRIPFIYPKIRVTFRGGQNTPFGAKFSEK